MSRKRSRARIEHENADEIREHEDNASNGDVFQWDSLPRNAVIPSQVLVSFFQEIRNVVDLSDGEILKRMRFLVRHRPPANFRLLKIKSKFLALVKRLGKVEGVSMLNDDCLNDPPWRLEQEVKEGLESGFLPNDLMSLTVRGNLFELWPVVSFMQGIGCIDGRASVAQAEADRIISLLMDVQIQHPNLSLLLDPPLVLWDLTGVNIAPVHLPIALAPGIPGLPAPRLAYPGAQAAWVCASELVAGELISHLRHTSAPHILPAGVQPLFVYVNAPYRIR